MRLRTLSVVLLALLLAAMAMVPMVSADDALQNSANEKIVTLFTPIDREIQSTLYTTIIDGKEDNIDRNNSDYSTKLVEKYRKNLDLILDTLEQETDVTLSHGDREDMKQIIIKEHIGRVSWEMTKKKLGVKETDFSTVFLESTDNLNQKATDARLYMPNSLTLVQVSADVYGGAGFDGGWRPYNVNGGNTLYRVDWYSGSGYTLYQCRFYDEDVPSPAGADATYDAYRLAQYGTIQDTQGFYINNNNEVDFHNDYDNGNTYGTVLGQHGHSHEIWSAGTPIYVSNVWNHAMSTTDRNSNMAKEIQYY